MILSLSKDHMIFYKYSFIFDRIQYVMMPLLFISSDKQHIDTQIERLIKQYSIASYNCLRIEPGSTGIGIDQIRNISQHITTQPDGFRLIAIYQFNMATIEAQNSLLRMLEEKNQFNLFVLVTNSLNVVIPTIRSRVGVLKLDQELNVLFPVNNKSMEHIYSLLLKKENYQFLNHPFLPKTREETIGFIDELIIFFKPRLLSDSEGSIKIIKKSFEIKNQIQSLSCNHLLALDNLLIFIHKTSTMKHR